MMMKSRGEETKSSTVQKIDVAGGMFSLVLLMTSADRCSGHGIKVGYVSLYTSSSTAEVAVAISILVAV